MPSQTGQPQLHFHFFVFSLNKVKYLVASMIQTWIFGEEGERADQ